MRSVCLQDTFAAARPSARREGILYTTAPYVDVAKHIM